MSTTEAGASLSSSRVTRADIEAKLRQVAGEVGKTTEAVKPNLMAIGAATATVLLTVAYLLGRRKGRRKATVVEIRRV